MTAELQQHVNKALRLLQSVQARAESDEPDAVISTAYYAMHHAACAVLLWRGEKLPKTHASLIGRFGLIVRDLGEDGREAGASLHDAFARRTKGDYDAAASFDRGYALAARDQAARFIAYWRSLLRKGPP
ncbi:MAG TPA: HEPN domain-containing protein [Reyranella sp.]|nr:HEPN domain-containing protein [Reyranella sp.]